MFKEEKKRKLVASGARQTDPSPAPGQEEPALVVEPIRLGKGEKVESEPREGKRAQLSRTIGEKERLSFFPSPLRVGGKKKKKKR